VFLSVRELELRKIQFDVEFPPGEVDFNDRTLRQVTPMRAEGTAELLNNTLGEIRVTGRMGVGMEVECARCLEPVPVNVKEPFDLFYRPGPEESAHHEIALDEGESQIGFYEGNGIELGDVLREHVLLSLPMQQVCSEAAGASARPAGRTAIEATAAVRPSIRTIAGRRCAACAKRWGGATTR
jgi:uncharacterized protein